MSEALPPELVAAAARSGLVLQYQDATGKTVEATEPALRAVLKAFVGSDVGATAVSALPPCIVGRENLALQQTLQSGLGSAQVILENGDTADLTFSASSMHIPALPAGYHQVRWQPQSHANEEPRHSHLLIAPAKPFLASKSRQWGAFVPTYALRDHHDSGIGTLRELSILGRWLGQRGCDNLATLPLLAGFYDKPFEPSPYSPVSRYFWNELYIDAEWVLSRDPKNPARKTANLLAQTAEKNPERAGRVDYAEVYAKRRAVWQTFLTNASSSVRREILEFVTASPEVRRYVRFRSQLEVGLPTTHDPDILPLLQAWAGKTSSSKFIQSLAYHAFGQWAMSTQLRQWKASSQRNELPGLYVDLPVGVHPDGYDRFRYPELFLQELEIGAPPDPMFWGGQRWGLPLIHPVRQRESGYEYFRACVKAHAEVGSWLRIDHIMGLHRLFCIPRDMPASAGIYVTYPAEELWAVMAIESTRHDCALVGEDLGTVPPDVRPMMKRFGALSMKVAQLEWPLEKSKSEAIHGISSDHMACINTHDLPAFASFYQTTKSPDGPTQSSPLAYNEAVTTHEQWCFWLAESSAAMVLFSLEDAWGETLPQNQPGTGSEAGNWTRRFALSLPEIMHYPSVHELVSGIQVARKTRSEKTS